MGVGSFGSGIIERAISKRHFERQLSCGAERNVEDEVRGGEKGGKVEDCTAEEVVLGETVVGGGVAVEDVDEKGGGLGGTGVGKGDCGGPGWVEIVFHSLCSADSLGCDAVLQNMAHEEGVGEGEEVFVGEGCR